MKNSGLAIFASGRGSNAEKIITYFKKEGLRISCIVSNKPESGVIDLAVENSIPQIILNRDKFYNSHELLAELEAYGVNFISLAGFLWLIPDYLVTSYRDKIINIHPALLPKYGGKGMYGMNVHKAVKESGDEVSGISIHIVNEEYDDGKIIFQASCKLDLSDSSQKIAEKVLQLEHRFYPPVLLSFIEFQS